MSCFEQNEKCQKKTKNCFEWLHLYNEASSTSADPKFMEIKYDPGLLGV